MGGERGVRTFAHAARFHLPRHLFTVVGEDDIFRRGKRSRSRSRSEEGNDDMRIACYV